MIESWNERSDSSAIPPKPKDIPRKVLFYRLQTIGVPILLLLPIAALFQLFDNQTQTAESHGAELVVRAEYPARFRYRTDKPLTITVENTGTRTIPKVNLELSKSYLDRFRELSFEPGVDQVTESEYIVEIDYLEPGEKRKLEVNYESKDAGSVPGWAAARSAENTTRVDFSTFALP